MTTNAALILALLSASLLHCAALNGQSSLPPASGGPGLTGNEPNASATVAPALRPLGIQVRVPDLTPTELSAPTSVAAGQTLSAGWTVKNVGNAEAKPTWQDRLYLSPTAAFNSSSARYLGSVDHEIALGADSTYDAQLKSTMPNVPPGHYFLILRLDYYDRVYEMSETNQYRSVPIEIRVPDLAPNTFEAPAVVDAGQSLTATWSVSNGGNADALPSWRDRLYLSADSVYSSGSDRSLGDVTHVESLAADSTYSAALKFTMPNVAPGHYFLIVQIDTYDNVYESAKTNQYRAVPIQIRVPDLTPAALAAPKAVDAGQEVTATWTAANRGDAAARPSWRDRLYLSADSVYSSGSDRSLGDVTHEELLAADASYSAALKFTMPNVAPGHYFLIVQVDTYDNVYESAKTNQYRAVPIQIRVPDLAPTKLVAPSDATVGQSLTAAWIVRNLGNAEARGSWHDRVYLSTNAVYNSSTARHLGDVVHEGGLLPGNTYVTNLTFTMPKVAAGSYYLVLATDHYDRVYESDEKNNLRVQSFGPESIQSILISATPATGAKKSPQISLPPPSPTTKRIEISVNGGIVGTLYGTTTNANPSIPLGPGVMSTGTNQVVAESFDAANSRVGSTAGVWEGLTEGMVTKVRIDEPTSSRVLYADDIAGGEATLLIRAYAAWFHVWTEPITGGHGFVSREEWVPLTNGQFRVHFYVDSVLVHTSTNGLTSDPFYHEFAYSAAGMDVGTHSVRVALDPPEGYRYASDALSFQVQNRHPDISVSRDVYPAGNYFNVTLTIRNRGSAAARMTWLREVMTGFQACCVEGSPSSAEVEWSFDPVSRQGELYLDFGANTVAAGATNTLSYKAVPVLFRNDTAYVFGGDSGGFGYADMAGNGSLEHWRSTTSTTSPWARRRALVDAVADAGHGSDYLLVTDPVNVKNAFGDAGAANVLTNMAELATLRNGTLGFYHSTLAFQSGYRPGALVALGHIMEDWSTKDQAYIARLDEDRIRCFTTQSELILATNQLPIEVALLPGDQVLVGNLIGVSLLNDDYHSRDEVVVFWGSSHGDRSGKLILYQFEYDRTNEFTVFPDASWDHLTNYTAMAIGKVHDGDRFGEQAWDDLVMANGTSGDLEVLSVIQNSGYVNDCCSGPWFTYGVSVETDYRTGDHFEVADLLGDEAYPEEIIVGDCSAGQIKIYTAPGPQYHPTSGYWDFRKFYAQGYAIDVTLEPQDGFAVGDVLGDSREEIVVADDSEDRISIYGYNPTADRFERKMHFAYPYHADDKLICGRMDPGEKQQILVFRGHSAENHPAGSTDVISLLEGETPGDRWALDGLINVDGRWANALTNNWTSEGHLLIVGENEIVPTFTKSWSISDWDDGGRVDYTDRDYASTGADGDSNTPELAAGRIVGNTAARIGKALRTSIELVREPWRLSNSRAFCASGTDPEHSDLFIDNRESIAGRLVADGFDVLERHRPDHDYFYAHEDGRDVIYLTGHGASTAWDEAVTSSNVGDDFDPGFTRPLIYAMSCLTGRYPDAPYTLSEQFLWKGAIGYIGSTALTYGWGYHGRGWSPRFAEAFFSRLQSDRTIGQSLKLTKRYRLSEAANTYASDWNKNRYHCAAYHLYGDPKATFSWISGALALANVRPLAPASSEPVQGPLNQYQLQVPMYAVTAGANSDDVVIPDGDQFGETGRPALPFYAVTIRFPKGQIVQSVELQQRSAPLTSQGLRLPPIVPYPNARRSAAVAAAPASGWWPDREFAWSLTENPDGTRDLSLKAFAFFYNSDTTEARFYSNYVFAIRWTTSTVSITKLTPDRHAYAAGAVVNADLTVDNTGVQPIDAVAEVRVFTNEHDLVAQLPSIAMPSLKALGWAKVQWDTAQALGGDYALEVLVRDAAGNELDRARTEFQVGSAAGAITRFEVQPKTYAAGDDVTLAGTFSNTGTTSLDGSVVIAVQDTTGNTVTELRRSFSGLAAGGAFRFDTVWSQASLGPGQCQFLVYAQFGGQTTGMSVYSEESSLPLQWETVTVANGQVQLSWSGQTGQTYAVDFTPDLGVIPFTCVASNLPAMSPRSIFVDDAVLTKGFYRLRQEAR